MHTGLCATFCAEETMLRTQALCHHSTRCDSHFDDATECPTFPRCSLHGSASLQHCEAACSLSWQQYDGDRGIAHCGLAGQFFTEDSCEPVQAQRALQHQGGELRRTDADSQGGDYDTSLACAEVSWATHTLKSDLRQPDMFNVFPLPEPRKISEAMELPLNGKMQMDDGYLDWELDGWPANGSIDVDAHIVVHDGEAFPRFAFVSRMPTKFHYRLELELLDMQFSDREDDGCSCNTRVPVRLMATRLAWQADVPNGSLLQVASGFHQLLTGKSHSPIFVACICITGPGICIDSHTMEDAIRDRKLPPDTPRWLPKFARRVSGLRILEHHLDKFAPLHVAPPNPLIMEGILRANACKANSMLAMIGKGVIREMAALSLYVDSPLDIANRLEQRLNDLVSDRVLASWMLSGGISANRDLLNACSAHVKTEAEATKLVHAIAGACFLESGPPAVACFWAWLAGSCDLHMSLMHMHITSSFAARTETYTELHWVKGEQLKQMRKFKPHVAQDQVSLRKLIPDEEEYLLVLYTQSDHTLYRKTNKGVQELRYQVAITEWLDIVWDPCLRVFCSPTKNRNSLLATVPEGMRLQPVPNKVMACLLAGRSFLSLVSLKARCGPRPSTCSRLMETWKSGLGPTLHVVYPDSMVLLYRRERDRPGFGIEIGEDNKERQLGFSEYENALISPTRNTALPNLVLEWICGVQSLVQLAPLPQEWADESFPASSRLNTSKQRICRWTRKSRQFSCQLVLNEGQYFLVAREERRCSRSSSWEESPWEDLWYDNQQGLWLMWGGQGNTSIPTKVVLRAKKSIDYSECVNALRKDMARFPWLSWPYEAMPLITSLITDKDLDEVQRKLGHKFSNPSLLVEAFTHCSSQPGAFPSCERLSLIGEHTVRAYVLVHSVNFESISISVSASSGCGLYDKYAESVSLAVPRDLVDWREWLERPPDSRPADAATSMEEMQRVVLACCNHSSYAHSCALLELPAHLQHGSPELEASIRRYMIGFQRSHVVSVSRQVVPIPLSEVQTVLGDLFLACVAALVLDGNRTKAEELIDKHRNSCLLYASGRMSGDWQEQRADLLTGKHQLKGNSQVSRSNHSCQYFKYQ